MQNQSAITDYPWDTTTAPNTAPDITNPYVAVPYVPPATTGIAQWPPVEEDPPIPGTEEFHDFMCWLAGFTDPDTPPSQKRWEAFQEKVREMAVLFWEYKKEQRAREFNKPFTITTSMSASSNSADISAGLVGNKSYTYEELSTM